LRSPLLSRELAALGLDLADTLREEPRFLTDASFIGALHVELRERLGAGDARAALLQLGFLHGLRDALELVTQGLRSVAPADRRPGRPRIALALESAPASRGEPLRGVFRDGVEARAVLGGLGKQLEATCALTSGYASGWLSGLFDADLFAREEACAAAGHPRCEFRARTPEDWSGDSDVALDAARVPFSPLRDLVARHLASVPQPSEAEGGMESSAPVIHVWGPVMVIPYAGAEETLAGLDLIRRDPGARDVRVVVVDLAGAIIDEAFGALELERVLERIERLGAEPILTGIAPLSERTVAGLEVSHLIVRKDLSSAIATAFQVADAMRRGL
jgi:anti-anti-sigma regulatory factor